MLIILILTFAQAGCSGEEGVGPYKLTPLTDKVRNEFERDRRELLTIEDVKIGDGPLAVWGRRLEADIEVRYADGKPIYHGPMWINIGFDGDVFVYNASDRAGALSYGQPGVWLGLNGMAVGGKRRFTVNPKLVDGNLFIRGVYVDKKELIVEATLTASCVPVLLRVVHMTAGRYFIDREVGCRATTNPVAAPVIPSGASTRQTPRGFSDHSECQQAERQNERLTKVVHALRNAWLLFE